MLVSQLCVFDYKTNSKLKWVKKFVVRLCFLDYLVYFVKILICHALLHNLMMMQLELEQLKLSPSTKSATVDKFIICWMLRSLWQNKLKQDK